MIKVDFVNLYKKSKRFYYHLPYIRQRRQMNFFYLILNYFSFFILFLVIVCIFLSVLISFDLKNAYNQIILGKSNLETAVYSIKNKNFDDAVRLSKEADNNFSDAINSIEKYKNNILVKNIYYFSSQINDIDYLLLAGKNLSILTNKISGLGLNINEIVSGDGVTFTSIKKEDKIKILDYIYKSAPDLVGIDANLKLAVLNLNKIKYQGILFFIKPKIENFTQQLQEAENIIAKATPFAELFPRVLGYPKKSTYLIILENSDELRATGGFIGTYGILETENGEITRFDTHDIYHMDMPVKDLINETPPKPINDYLVNKWYMRDANWSPDWPTSAKKIEYFYDKENKLLPPKDQINNFFGQFDGVIAFTPEFVTDLLAIYGPITIDGEKYDKDNFVDLLQYKVERGNEQLGIPSWHRKETVGKILEQLKLVYFNQSFIDIYKNINIFSSNLDKKNILVYFQDPGFQKISLEQNWAGNVKDKKGDYVLVVDSNMASLKTDAVIRRNINYKTEEKSLGLFSNLEINYSHNGKFDWKTTRYRSYTRIYVPKGSLLIKADGFKDNKIDVYEELNKTVFGGFITIEPGKIGNIKIYYQLPSQINNMIKNKGYNLFIQKQPGSIVDLLSVDLKFKSDIKLFIPTGFNAIKNEDNNIHWESDLKTDKEYSIITY
jgi:hypothetical protein